LDCCISAAFFRVVRRLSSEPASAWHVSPARACADESTALPGWPGCRRSDSSNGPRRPWCRQCAGAPALRRVDPHSRTCGGLKTSRALLRYALFRVRNRAQMSEGALAILVQQQGMAAAMQALGEGGAKRRETSRGATNSEDQGSAALRRELTRIRGALRPHPSPA